ncbi:phosphatase activator [Rhizoctonia solani AG-1 IA]|uniref:Phosphatase activator n=1 Tax=Thanatephorus cucumeris (strain AG1-IA) TaxID=983506 RepID=L8WRS3_THACA|nr:phosphatase activator [Rhizoctonia solani AG-1 IA]
MIDDFGALLAFGTHFGSGHKIEPRPSLTANVVQLTDNCDSKRAVRPKRNMDEEALQTMSHLARPKGQNTPRYRVLPTTRIRNLFIYTTVKLHNKARRAWLSARVGSASNHHHTCPPLPPPMATAASPITQVSQTPTGGLNLAGPGQPQLLARLQLDLRGVRFSVDREKIMNLPESVLLCLFPNGLVLSRQSVAGSSGYDDEEGEDVYIVDFDPDCFAYVLEFFRISQDRFYGTATTPGLLAAQQSLLDTASPSSSPGMDFGSPNQNPLLSKQAIIVLREELEYFVIPPDDGGKSGAGTDQHGIANQVLLDMKRESGVQLLEKRQIFTALQRNVNKENNVAEQHLIDMLCMSGFNRDDAWGYRALEPSRCCISSIALVLLKTGINHPAGGPVTVDQQQMATAQKLLLFWRKPARKCWWDGAEAVLPPSKTSPSHIVKLWARRVWTLELSLLRIIRDALFIINKTSGMSREYMPKIRLGDGNALQKPLKFCFKSALALLLDPSPPNPRLRTMKTSSALIIITYSPPNDVPGSTYDKLLFNSLS